MLFLLVFESPAILGQNFAQNALSLSATGHSKNGNKIGSVAVKSTKQRSQRGNTVTVTNISVVQLDYGTF